MKKLLGLSLLLITGIANAAPVVNENLAPSGIVTIYPDHLDPNHYYVAPNYVTFSKNDAGVPNFSFMQYRTPRGERVALVQMTLVPQYSRGDLDDAETKILAKNPNAKFSGMPFMNSNLDFMNTYSGLVKSHNCSHITGLIGQEQSCSFVLNSMGIKVFMSGVKGKKLMTTFNFIYGLDAMDRQADGTVKSIPFRLGIAVRIDGSQLQNFPQLFQL